MKDIYFKAMLVDFSQKSNIPIVCKIYNFNNLYFAQEICTGSIFPVLNSRSINTLNDKIIPIRENFIEGFSVVIPKCIKQGQVRIVNNIDIYDIKNHTFKYDKYKTFVELTKDLNNFDINNIKKYSEDDFFEDSSFDPIKYAIEMVNNYEYISSIFDAALKNNEIYSNISQYINNVTSNNLSYTHIPFNIPNKKSQYNDNYAVKSNKIDIKEISKFGYDLSDKEDNTKLINREEEIKKIIKSICIKNSSVLLIGESGSGKTAIVEEIARLTKTDNVFLKDKIIFNLNSNNLISGTKYRGDFEQNIEKVICFCKKHKRKIILFIDEIHTLFGLGVSNESSNDAMNILKPYISDGTIIVIGATTKKEYEKYLTQDEAFLRRFEKININNLDKKSIVSILLDFNKKLQEKYSIKFNISDNDLKQIFDLIVELTDIKHQRIIGDISITNPTLSKYILDDAYAECIYENKKEVTIKELAESIRNCDKISPSKKEEIADLLLEQFSQIEYKDNKIEKKDKNVIKLSFN